jgi:hypothetical protein
MSVSFHAFNQRGAANSSRSNRRAINLNSSRSNNYRMGVEAA